MERMSVGRPGSPGTPLEILASGEAERAMAAEQHTVQSAWQSWDLQGPWTMLLAWCGNESAAIYGSSTTSNSTHANTETTALVVQGPHLQTGNGWM